MSQEPSRAEKDYGLPRLTFEEGARVLGIRVGDFMSWVMATVRPGESRWSGWNTNSVPLPEALIRLYLTQRLAQSLPSAATGEQLPDNARKSPDQAVVAGGATAIKSDPPNRPTEHPGSVHQVG